MTILENIPLAPFTTFKLGGPARWYCPAESPADVIAALAFAHEHSAPWFILGRGSNVLVADRGYNGMVIHLAGLEAVDWDESWGTISGPVGRQRVRCGAGLAIAALAMHAAERGLSGLEFAGGLPGSVGGAVYMNARAYGSEMADIVTDIDVVTPDGVVMTRNKEDLEYSYKHSALMSNREIVISVSLDLGVATDPDEKAGILNKTAENRSKRVDMGQFTYPNAGCIFKNDYDCGIPSGRLIDECGLRGFSIGGASVFENHANFLVNTGSATAEEVRQLIRHVQRVVREKRGIQLEEEVQYLGFDDGSGPDSSN